MMIMIEARSASVRNVSRSIGDGIFPAAFPKGLFAEARRRLGGVLPGGSEKILPTVADCGALSQQKDHFFFVNGATQFTKFFMLEEIKMKRNRTFARLALVFMLVLAHTWQIQNNEIHTSEAQVFYVPKGTLIEMYQTTLHLSPCRVCDEGFRDIVILPKGTNTPLSRAEKLCRDESGDPEAALLLQRNKWVLAHPERKPLIDQGAHPGLIGENKELKY